MNECFCMDENYTSTIMTESLQNREKEKKAEENEKSKEIDVKHSTY